MLSLLSGIFILYRKPDDDTAAATDSIIYLKRSVMERNDLVTYGKADTGAPVFRAALIKLLLDMREFILGYAPAVVSYDNDRVFFIITQQSIYLLAVPAVLYRVIEYI